MSSLIFPPISPTLKIAIVGNGSQELANYLQIAPSDLEQSDVAIFSLSAISGIDEESRRQWEMARDLYIPSLVAVIDLEKSDSDFEDMVAIGAQLLDPLINPFLVIYDDQATAAALIDLDSLNLIDYSGSSRVVRDSDPEHKLLVFEFRKEYLDALEEFGHDSFQAGLTFPALPIFPAKDIGKYELFTYLAKLPSRG